MKNGKISESILKRSVLKQLHTNYSTDFGKCKDIVVATNPVTIDVESLKSLSALSVISAINNVATSGAKPLGVEVCLLIPTTWNEAQLRELVKEIGGRCSELGVEILGGHTQVTRAVKNAVITVTGVGRLSDETDAVTKVQPGMDIIMTGYAGYAGTSLIVEKKMEQLLERFAQPFLAKALKYIDYLSIQSEAAVAVKSGATAMHDVSEGGVFGALWEMASVSGVGLDINLKKIPIRQETVEICEFFDINPYELISSGSMLMAAADGNGLVRALAAADIPAVCIGKVTEGNDRVLLSGEERRFLEPPKADELYKVV